VTDYGPVIPDGWRRRVLADLAASARPGADEADGTAGADGSACWDELDAERRRKAADELTALTEELNLYDDGRGGS
jgi:hypothetical protein